MPKFHHLITFQSAHVPADLYRAPPVAGGGGCVAVHSGPRHPGTSGGVYSTARLLVESAGKTSHWRHNGHGGVSNHQPHDCLLNGLFRRISKKTSKLRVTGLCEARIGAQMASNAENVSIWLRHYEHWLKKNS